MEKNDIIKLRDYFKEHDKSTFEHWAYTYLDKLTSSPIPDTNGKEQDGCDRKIISFFTWLQNEGYEMSDTKPHHCYLGGNNYIITELLNKFNSITPK